MLTKHDICLINLIVVAVKHILSLAKKYEICIKNKIHCE